MTFAVTEWRFIKFGLIVTGETEEQCLPSLFRIFTAGGTCLFEVIRRIGQRSPILSERRRRTMVGTGKAIPDRDAEQIGFPARKYLAKSDANYVLLVDDLEADRSAHIQEVFSRYRLALDEILPARLVPRAAVHFLVNMLEAYYFADAAAPNRVLGTELDDFEGGVETIPHPKNWLKSLHRGFDEKEHGAQILAELDVTHILSRQDSCASLRTMFAWVSEAVGDRDLLPPGQLLPTTERQIEAVREQVALHD